MNTNWDRFIDDFGWELLRATDGENEFWSGRSNPIADALDDQLFMNKYQDLPNFNRMAIVRIAILCQMSVFDREGGPEGDGRPKALRRHWYSYFKSEIAQPLAIHFGDFKMNDQGVREMNDDDWASRLSMAYAELVDSGEVTYRQLWVEDGSRMFESNWERLYRKLNLLICVEKDSLFPDFKAAATAIGAKALYSGKGKSSKAAIEKVLRDAYDWDEDHTWGDPFEDDKPLVVLHISDYDYDGEAVIGPTFAEQARRYTRNIIEARIGVNPSQVSGVGKDLRDAWYSIKVSNKGYRTWAEEKAIYQTSCSSCGTGYVVEGIGPHFCDDCGKAFSVREGATPHGFEVESIRTRDYYRLIADAFMRVIPFEYTVSQLRIECTADPEQAVSELVGVVLEGNQTYQDLLKEFDRLEAIKEEFEAKARRAFEDIVEGHESDWEDEEDDPTPDDFRNHMTRYAGSGYANVWRPFSRGVRTSRMVDWVKEDHDDDIQGLIDEEITW